MAATLDIRKRVLYAKYFLFRARSAQAESSELAVATSLLVMHDAAELVMLAVSDHLGLNPNWQFMQFWNTIKQSGRKEPGQKLKMRQLNELRVGLKHSGTLPHVETVRDLMPRVETFCEDLAKDFLDIDFAELGLEDLIGDDDVRSTLHDARQALQTGDRNTAFLNVRLAFDKLHRLISKDVSRIRKPQGIKIPKSALPNETSKGLLNLQGVVFDLVSTVNSLMLGIDPVKYRFLMANTPAVSWTLSGLHQAMFTHDYNTISDDTFNTCFEFVVEVALNASQ